MEGGPWGYSPKENSEWAKASYPSRAVLGSLAWSVGLPSSPPTWSALGGPGEVSWGFRRGRPVSVRIGAPLVFEPSTPYINAAKVLEEAIRAL